MSNTGDLDYSKNIGFDDSRVSKRGHDSSADNSESKEVDDRPDPSASFSSGPSGPAAGGPVHPIASGPVEPESAQPGQR
eukprot:8330909-Pyramimonas_sp.AAC.1